MADVLNADALHHELDRLEGWGGTTEGLEKRYTFADFNQSIAFVNRVAAVAEELNHHPDIAVSWDTVTLRLVSHSVGGVTQDDVELARRLDPLTTDNPSEARSIAPDAPDVGPRPGASRLD